MTEQLGWLIGIGHSPGETSESFQSSLAVESYGMHSIFPAKNFCDKAREMLLTRERSLETWCQGFLLGTDHICSPLPGIYPNPRLPEAKQVFSIKSLSTVSRCY